MVLAGKWQGVDTVTEADCVMGVGLLASPGDVGRVLRVSDVVLPVGAVAVLSATTTDSLLPSAWATVVRWAETSYLACYEVSGDGLVRPDLLVFSLLLCRASKVAAAGVCNRVSAGVLVVNC